MLLDEIILLTIISIATITGLIVYINKRQAIESKLFLLICFSIGGWVIVNYVSDHPPSETLLYLSTKLSFVAAYVIVLLMLVFVYNFPNRHKVSRAKTLLLSGSLLLVTALSLSSGIVASVDIKNQITVVETGNLYIVFVIVMCAVFAEIIHVLYKNIRNKQNPAVRNQTKLLILGSTVAFTFGLVTSILLPNLLNLWVAAKFGPLAGIILLIIFAISIVRYQMFDIRYVVLRFLAYILSLTIIITLFISLAFTVTNLLFGDLFVPLNQQIYYVLTALIVALLYGPIKQFVDQGTNRLFFQQSYSVHDALEKISSFSTSSVDATSIQKNTLSIIDETIRPDYTGFIVYDTSGHLKPTTHVGNFPAKSLQLKDFLQQLSTVKQKLVFTDEITSSRNHMKEYVELSRIGLIVHLSTHNKSIGYLVLGNKKNGSHYSQHDQQLLTLAANDLALALQNALAFQEIREFNATLQAKVNKATDALKRTNDKLIALDDTKDEFISMASHQLRTPLTSVKGYISMMLEGDLGKINSTQRQALEEAFNSSQRMVFLISDFLNVSRIRTGKFIMEKNETDLNKIVIEEITQLRELAGLRDQTINYTPPKDFPIVMLDETKTRQVMMNFIDNAIFYTPKNGTIDIVLEQTDKEIIFKVTDSGIGVPKNVQHRLFTKFFRAENARNARPDGTGLGLFMGQKIIDAQGGKIIFHSIENQGSTFGFRFPAKKIVKS